MQSHQIDIGLNSSVTVHHDMTDDKCAVAIFSPGFGTTAIRNDFRHGLVEQFRRINIGTCAYLYPERDANAITDDLLLSSGLATLRAIIGWVAEISSAPIILYGSSFGAVISLEATLLTPASMLVLTSPPLDLVKYRTLQVGDAAMQRWRESGSTTLEYPTGSFRSSYRFIEEAQWQNLGTRLRNAQLPPTLLLHAGRDEGISLDDLEPLRSNPSVQWISYADMNHGFNLGPFSEAEDAILDFVLSGHHCKQGE